MDILLLSALLMTASEPVLSPGPGNHADTLVHGGVERSFGYHMPENLDSVSGPPLVFVLHGGGGTARSVERLTGFSALADSAGFVAVYPEAVNRHWNDGRGVKRFRSQREDIDDVGFIGALIDLFVKQGRADPGRVCAAGISNGGMMCLRLGLELPDRLAAVAAVAAAMPEKLVDKARTEEADSPRRYRDTKGSELASSSCIPVLIINGTEDPLVPWQGGGVGLLKKRGRVLSTDETVRFWAERNGCDSQPRRAEVPDLDPDDGMWVRTETYRGRNGSEVVLYAVEGGGHTWPGGRPRPLSFGRRCSDIDATRVIWEFLSGHRR